MTVYEVMLILSCAAVALALFFAAYEYVTLYRGSGPSVPAGHAAAAASPVTRPTPPPETKTAPAPAATTRTPAATAPARAATAH